ncbi:MAG: hypothetical protein GY829_08995, partial [Gammaproteobacteria bacterium]|nr:hypothetical protein [Gammaproteobacteria bacterium]
PDNAVLLELKKPDALIKSVTRKIMASGHLEVSVTPICGRVNYDDRIVISGTLEAFKKHITEYYHSGIIHADYFFMKTNQYSDENEFRIMWFGHNNKDENVFSAPVVPYNFERDHVIVNGIDFEENFAIGV